MEYSLCGVWANRKPTLGHQGGEEMGGICHSCGRHALKVCLKLINDLPTSQYYCKAIYFHEY